MNEFRNLMAHIKGRISHAEKRVDAFKETHGENPEQTHNYFGGWSLGYWEGKLDAYNSIFDQIKEIVEIEDVDQM